MPDRDYAREMLDAIEAALPASGGFTSSEIAEKLVAQLGESDPDLLHGWLDANARTILTNYVTSLLGHRRRMAARQRRTDSGPTSVFSDALAAHAQGNPERLHQWLEQTYVIDEENTRKRLGELTKTDLQFVETGYAETIKESELERAFIQALRRKVKPGQTVADVWSEERILQMRESLAKAA